MKAPIRFLFASDMRLSIIIAFSLMLTSFMCPAQNPLGSWRALLNFSRALDVDELNNEVYVATANSIFVYNKLDNSVETITRVNGLSDVGIRTLKAVPGKNTVIVGYENGNIDLIRNRVITNVSDVRNSSVAGNKAIRHISVGEEFAYLSTGLGVLAFDVDRREVRNTYSVVPQENLQINHTAVNGDMLCAATSQGLYCGSLSADLTIFSNWNVELGLNDPFGNVNHVEFTGQLICASQNDAPAPGLYTRPLSGSLWTRVVETGDLRSLRAQQGGLLFTTSNVVQLRGADATEVLINFNDYQGISANPVRAIVDDDMVTWVAEQESGLVRRASDGTAEFIAPSGPGTNNCFTLYNESGEVWIASGAPGRPGLWNNSFTLEGFYQLKDGRWTNYTRSNFPFLESGRFFDIPNVYRYPGSEERILVGSYFSGVAEIINGVVVNHFTDENSTLTGWPAFVRDDGKAWIGVGGFVGTNNGDVWMLNSRGENGLAVYRNTGEWESYRLNSIPENATLTHMLLSRAGHLWIVVNRQGVLVFDPNYESGDEGVRQRLFNAQQGNGSLPTNDVYAITEDIDGTIWVGTNDGIGVFFSPFDALSTNPSEARTIIVEQDGIFQPLFENQAISVIEVDGANRKWVGTYGSGAFLMSADGTEQLLNFTVLNSPLLSNTINDIVVDEESGDVYIATERGLMVYTGDASRPEPINNCTTVYPNPVRENYTGPIAIKGLTRDAEVRITDTRGNLIASIVSNGGTAVWDGRNLNRERVATGVYFALSTDREGQSACVSKILVVK